MRLALCLLILSFSALAKPESIEISKNKKVTIDVPTGWEFVKDLYGIPITVLGPWENKSRPVLMFTYTGVPNDKVKEDEFEAVFKEFKAEKESWVAEHKGTLTKYEPTTKVNYRKDFRGHYIGADYTISGTNYSERSYYLWCKNELYNIKWSINDGHKKHIPALIKMVETFKCE